VIANCSIFDGQYILQIDPPLQGDILLPLKLIATTCPVDKHCLPVYLVESNFEVLVVRCRCRSVHAPPIARLSDLVLGRFIPLKSIGDNALFLGSSTSTTLSVSTKVLTTLARNTVIYGRTCDYVAQYHLATETLSPALDDSDLDGSAPCPYSLIRLILTCCAPSLWYVLCKFYFAAISHCD
jgi:hypothetical protein